MTTYWEGREWLKAYIKESGVAVVLAMLYCIVDDLENSKEEKEKKLKE